MVILNVKTNSNNDRVRKLSLKHRAAGYIIDDLRLFYPQGPWCLTKIIPDGKATTLNFFGEDEADLQEFIAKHNGVDNLYFQVNQPRGYPRKKPEKSEMKTAWFLHVDADAPKVPGSTPDEALVRVKEFKDAILNKIVTYPLKPTTIIDSGNGYHIYWRIEPVELGTPEAIEAVESRNSALISFFGGDRSCRDVSRIMRVAGTVNIATRTKRAAGLVNVRTGLVEHNDLTYRLEQFPVDEEPQLDDSVGVTNESFISDVDQLPVSDRIKQIIRSGADPDGADKSRSGALWQCLLALTGKGCSDDTIIATICANPIGDHLRDRSDFERKLLQQIDKARQQASTAGKASKTRETLETVCLADVKPEHIRWLWPERFALGKFSLLTGLPDLGKSQVTFYMAAQITTGGEWPCDEGAAPLGNVIILSAEDDPADTIRPRLEAAKADVNRIHLIQAVKQQDGVGRRGFDLTRDIVHLDQEVSRIGDVKLIIIDPISAYMGKPGKVDSHKDTDVRATLAPLQDLAARTRAAVIGVAHLNKSKTDNALSRVSGSLAFVAAARASFLVVKDPNDDERRLFIRMKNNLSKVHKGLAFTIKERRLKSISYMAPAVEWDSDFSTSITAEEALGGGNANGASEAQDFIRDFLKDGRQLRTDIDAAGVERGFSKDQIRRAGDKLHVKIDREGFPSKSWWSLP
jgi:hypothetical protein